ncbi:MAG: hypothetical protein P1U68_08520 [Verrucomicrobiales bacterium]|nr:hypothetical protein [Verrucomicrobiales bacterium]
MGQAQYPRGILRSGRWFDWRIGLPLICLIVGVGLAVFKPAKDKVAEESEAVSGALSPGDGAVTLLESDDSDVCISVVTPVRGDEVDEADEEEVSFSNYSHSHLHHFDFDEAARILKAAGLEWPRLSPGVDDDVVNNNLRIREREALAKIFDDPQRAVNYMERQIIFEENKFVTRSWMTEFKENPTTPVFSGMMASISDQHAEIIVREELPKLRNAESFARIAMERAEQRSDGVRLRIYALLADGDYLSGVAGERLETDLRNFVGDIPEGGSWTFEVTSRQDYEAFQRRQGDSTYER